MIFLIGNLNWNDVFKEKDRNTNISFMRLGEIAEKEDVKIQKTLDAYKSMEKLRKKGSNR